MPRRLGQLARVPITELRGVGTKRANSFSEFGIESVLDLLGHYPRRYVDRTNEAKISDAVIGEEALIIGTVENINSRRIRGGRTMVTLRISDETGRMSVNFFNQPWRVKQLAVGRTAAFFGKVDAYQGRRQLVNPVVDLLGDRTGRIIPLYPQSEKAGLMSWEIAELVSEALERAGDFAEPLPEEYRDKLDLPDRDWAMHQIHEPESMEAARKARKRLAFDELFRLQTVLVMRKRALERNSVGIAHTTSGEILDKFFSSLPFELTGAQKRAIEEIRKDMAKAHPMHRLLQGDVGSGKTIVAVATMLMAVQGGYQGALMAPTEVLAEQHFMSVRSLLDGLMITDSSILLGERPLKVALLTSQVSASERSQILDELVAGTIDILIGTHALLTEDVKFKQLGAVVIDEQHRFGVEQRAALRGKGTDPDVLVMTATPIPRTAAMTVYGDLDTTTLDEMPPGRTPILTQWSHGKEEVDAWRRIRDEIESGRQAYVVCPLIEESEKLQAKSAKEEFDQLSANELDGLRIGLLHGQLPSKEKEAIMNAFRNHELDVLVATTVIEVGVDVPNATVMVIESADRFGIAQLHQLRGRVGRGAEQSYCYLLGESVTGEGAARLEAMERTTDGFELAEVDLELRGEGTIMGTRQKGSTDLKLASLRRDKDLIKSARETAFEIVDSDPILFEHDELEAEIRDILSEDEVEFLFKN
jgi:ATP-dependent DNA helicase RecG